jgi:hypothetical protein
MSGTLVRRTRRGSARSGANLTINLLGVRLADRPAFFGELFPHLQAMRAKTSRPHWLIIDEAHHLLPGSWDALPSQSPVALGETILVTVHPDHLAPSILSMIDVFARSDLESVRRGGWTSASTCCDVEDTRGHGCMLVYTGG